MTLQQLEYVVAVDKHRHFVRAAEECEVTQSTLSAMIQKLENELDVVIFDRNCHPVKPTAIGARIIAQAKVVLFHGNQLRELARLERTTDAGEVRLGIIPTVAPYVLPKLIGEVQRGYPNVNLTVLEMQTSHIIKSLANADIDMGLLATPLEQDELLEVPVYYEKFVAYQSPREVIFNELVIEATKLPLKHLWVLQEGHCFRSQIFNFCGQKDEYSSVYEAGSIGTLVKIVDENGGYTIIPELHIDLLSPEQRRNLRRFAEPEPVREVSLVIRRDFVRERLLNIIADAVKQVIPEQMLDARLKKFAIRI